MADPIQTHAYTDTGVELVDDLNTNATRRHGYDVKAITNADHPYTVLATDEFITVDSSSGVVTLDLEAISSATAGRTLVVKGIDVTNTVTLDANGSDTLDGSATKTIGTLDREVTLVADQANSEWLTSYRDVLP